MRNSHPWAELEEKQQGLGIPQPLVAEVIDASCEIIGLVNEKCCLGCEAAHAARGAGD